MREARAVDGSSQRKSQNLTADKTLESDRKKRGMLFSLSPTHPSEDIFCIYTCHTMFRHSQMGKQLSRCGSHRSGNTDDDNDDDHDCSSAPSQANQPVIRPSSLPFQNHLGFFQPCSVKYVAEKKQIRPCFIQDGQTKVDQRVGHTTQTSPISPRASARRTLVNPDVQFQGGSLFVAGSAIHPPTFSV